MGEFYGQEAAVPGYQIMKDNIQICFDDDSEQNFQGKLKGLPFENEQMVLQFIDYVSTYFIVHNMQVI